MDALALASLLRSPLAQLPRELELVPLPGPFDATVTPPGSKSITNRALLLAALAEGESELSGALLDAEDAQVMMDALRQLGAVIDILDRGAGRVRVRGGAGRFRGGCTLDLRNAGTATRFLTAAACLADAPVVIDGSARMRQRPNGELIEMLRSLGARVEELGRAGFVPLRVHPLEAAAAGATVRVGRTASSQFVSALLMLGPMLTRGLRVEFHEPPTSPAYIDMTLAIMRSWLDARVPDRPGPGGTITLAPGAYRARRYAIEPDASGATYFWAAAAVTPGSRLHTPLDGAPSVQSDAAFGQILASLRGGGEFDLSLMPDAAMTLAAVACFVDGPTTIMGLRTLRVKETDRLAAVKAELEKVGAEVEVFSYATPAGGPDEGLRIRPPAGGIDCSARGAPRVVFETYDDHRMAMSLAVIGLRRPNVVVRDPQCVAKTYPGFWRDWARLYESAAKGGRRS